MYKKLEPPLFYLCVILLAMPIFCYDFFVTNDGPAHVFNANIISHYFGKYYQNITALFTFNTSIEPNWIGHIILIIFKLFFSGAFSEKLLVSLILITFPISIRNLVININKKNAIIAWLSIPFAYNFMLGLGFYNFTIGLVLLFFAMGYSVKTIFEFKGKYLFVILIYSILLYFSHLIVYGLFLVFYTMGIFLKRKETLKSIVQFVVLQLPLLLISIFFMLSHTKGETFDSLGFSFLFDWLIKARPLLVYNENSEAWFGYTVNSITILILVSGIFFTIANKNKLQKQPNFILFLTLTIAMLLLYFIVPNELVSGGFLNIRMLLLFNLFLIVLISFFDYKKDFLMLPIIVLITATIYQQKYKFTEIKVMSEDAKEITSVVKYLKEGKNLIPLNYCTNWLHTNLSNYIAADKLILLLDNYEANTVHFPLKWVPDAHPYPLLGNFSYSLNPSISIAAYETKTQFPIDYLLRWCYQQNPQDSISEKTNDEIKNNFKLIYTSPKGNAQLFERIPTAD